VTILHASDLHFGAPHRPEAAAALLELAREADAVVVSGDLTQRAKAAEYRAAGAFLARLGANGPRVAIPGNHDVPLYRVWERFAAPYRKYRRHIAPDLDTVLDAGPAGGGAPLVRFVAMNSSSPRRAIVNGRLSRRQLAFATAAFARSPAGACRILVVHHNLVRVGDEPRRRLGSAPDPRDTPAAGRDPPPLHGAAAVLDRLDEWGVELVLSGHAHFACQAPVGAALLVQAGTASSSRGRGPEQGCNTVNVVRLEPEQAEVVVYLYSEDAERFLPVESRRHPRRARGAAS